MAGSYDIGPRVGVQGENEFKKQIADINRNIKTLGTEMKAVTAEYAGNEKSVKALKDTNALLNQQIDLQRKDVSTLEQALKSAQEEYGANSKKAQEWEQKLNLANAELSKLEKQQKKTSDELKSAQSITGRVKTAYNELKDKIKEAADKHPLLVNGMKALGTAAKDVTAAVGKAAAAAAAGVAATGAAITAAATATISAAVSSASAVAGQADEIDKMSQKIGLSAEEYQKWNYTMSQSGVDISVMQTGIKTLRNEMEKARSGNEEATKTFKRLGISVVDASGNLRNQEDVMNEAITALSGMKDSTDRALLSQKLFGKAGSELTPLLNAGTQGIIDLRNNAEKLGIVLSNDTVKAGVQFGDTVDDMKRAIGGLKNNISAQLLPGMTMISKGLTDLVTGGQFAEKEIRMGVQKIIGVVKDIAPKIADFIKEMAPTIANLIAELAPPLLSATIEVMKELVKALIQTLKDNWPQIKEAGSNLLKTLWNAIKDLLPWLWTQVKTYGPQVVEKLVDAIKGALPKIKEVGKNLIEGLWNGIKDMGAWIGEKLKGFGNDIIDKVKGVFGIHSPSRVFRDQIGKNLALGIGEGFDSTMAKVSRDMATAIPSSFDATVNGTVGGNRVFDVTVPLSVDGATLAKVVSRYQWNAATGTVRALGIVG